MRSLRWTCRVPNPNDTPKTEFAGANKKKGRSAAPSFRVKRSRSKLQLDRGSGSERVHETLGLKGGGRERFLKIMVYRPKTQIEELVRGGLTVAVSDVEHVESESET
jgi:hypothetical protein